mmetsp:Transcript_86837/g.173389  ORF Transcript_86837/g.173389 Transcript_86837/m.173389 type:complete len:322 (+) Transcript_86837:688-1653(+)
MSRCTTHVESPPLRYYLNPGWRPSDGGYLRLWNKDESEARVGLAPSLDRIICFWADHRTPHEVLPAYRERAAISVWFHVPIEDQPPSRAPRPLASPSVNSEQERLLLANLRSTASSLRSRFHAEVRTNDMELKTALEALRPPVESATRSSAGHLRWVDSRIILTKCKTLLHQLLPSNDPTVGCTQLLLARASDEACWLPKLAGSRALVILPLSTPPASGVAGGGCASVHCKRHVVLREAMGRKHVRGGWPKAHDEPVHLAVMEKPVLHVFDCTSSPLYVMLRQAAVLAIYSFGETVSESDVRRRQTEAVLLPCEELPSGES